jgi:DNA helicase HerA-like ATPase
MDNVLKKDVGNEVSVIGTVISDDVSPSFEAFRFKAKPEKYVTPGTLVGTSVGDSTFLVGRITSSHEYNPHETSSKVTVRDAMNIIPDYPSEDLSLTIHRNYHADIICEVNIESIEKYEIIPPEKMAKSGHDVFLPPTEVIMDVMGLRNSPEDSLNLGTLAISISEEKKIPARIKRDVIQRHIFIGGTTGGGKSYGAKVLAEEIHRHKIPIIFFDTQNEFTLITKALGGEVLRPGRNLKVKLSSLSETELLGLIPTITHELHVNILTRAFLTMKEGGPTGIPQQTLTSQPRDNFSLSDLLREIARTADNMSAKQSTKDIILKRTEYYLGNYDFIGSGFNWANIITSGAVIDIDCKGFSRQSLQLILASTLRELNGLRKRREIAPYIVFIDEAHLFVPQEEGSPCKQIIRESVRMGRHHGICVVLITQSPIDIDKKTIRQCNTRLLFAVEPDQLQAIQGVRADATKEMIDRLPKAPVGTCLLTGTYETVKHAIPIRIRLMKNPLADGGEAPDIFSEVKKGE